ncbi:heme oxygenase [Neokomagataea thailandica NBRC 106555]|uniref:Heme oxygenase n=2 Tax=Neokomagataea TaxID=1223423 RepID=A0A4Y6V215_9PROT|nr:MULTISPECIES: biliverdin-producing heme oxygenase [Neokomagataea]QDH24043.1 hypothetical protein D5366_00830 [Neokomagataea tanensis]GBR50233.1 heme oxygenase [Neokomagataea thailandica NBRC 106555]
MNSRSDSALVQLRRACRTEHDGVDQIFSAFDLQDQISYGRFLAAHARVVPVLERWLRDFGVAEGTDWRAAALSRDLQALQAVQPDEILWNPKTHDGYAVGVLYVLEGSRLGGKVLAAKVSSALPKEYLSSGHSNGGWPLFLGRLQNILEAADESYKAEVWAGAREAFALFASAGRAALSA